MPQRSSILWAAALLTALFPALLFWIETLLSGNDGSQSYVWMSSGQCLGNQINDLLRSPQRTLEDFPLLEYGGAPMIALAFTGWCLSLRSGRARLGRIIARCAAAALLLSPLCGLLLVTLDAALDTHCLEAWGPPALLNGAVGTDLYRLAPPILVLAAVRAPRRAFIRRGRPARTALAILALSVTVLALAEAAPAGTVSSEGELDCAGFGDGTVRGLSTGEKGFLCQVRGYNSFYAEGGIEGWGQAPDRVVLAHGHHLCGLATRQGGNLEARAVQQAPHASLGRALAPLCPAVARWQEQEGKRKQEEEAAYVAEKEKACAAHRTHRPKIKPVRQRRATMWTEFWTINAWEDGYEGTVPETVEDLVGSERGALTIWAADEIGHACVTVESYTRRPPLEIRGGEEVVEVGYDSPKGSLALVDGWGNRLPALTPAGPGSYRVRVHLRGRKLVHQNPDAPDGAVQLLIMVFPGEQKKPTVYR
ncbi:MULTISPECIES: hypothetical protein [Streptosporangium]|uniref:Uncharacterized protein n=1 Tax=Streptosporangium brasiliense TaxID=47480 RepID=A0ABT9RM35_9ACTN|nr:hypothetical protein [Streptosporangium brasiliense]MDP9869902.1 hypothetical protein [Streptosporangium brasiliense]